jgi:hypothetical protein
MGKYLTQSRCKAVQVLSRCHGVAHLQMAQGIFYLHQMTLLMRNQEAESIT